MHKKVNPNGKSTIVDSPNRMKGKLKHIERSEKSKGRKEPLQVSEFLAL